jgi:hypothetical protein
LNNEKIRDFSGWDKDLVKEILENNDSTTVSSILCDIELGFEGVIAGRGLSREF